MAQRPHDPADGDPEPGTGGLLIPDRPSVPQPAGAAGARFGPAAKSPPGAEAGELLADYLNTWAAEFLRCLQLYGDSAGRAESAPEAARAVRRLGAAARRISGTLQSYRPLLDGAWADGLCTELGWLAALLAKEYECARQRDRLLGALHRLSDGPSRGGATASAQPSAERDGPSPGGRSTGKAGGPDSPRSAGHGERQNTRRGAGRDPGVSVGAARAGALLERRLTLSRTRAHSAALQAMGSSRFHAVADAVALLASEVPVDRERAARPAARELAPLADRARRRLGEAVAVLPLGTAGLAYNGEGLARSLAREAAGSSPGAPGDAGDVGDTGIAGDVGNDAAERAAAEAAGEFRGDTAAAPVPDAAWHRVRQLIRRYRYAREVLHGGDGRAAATDGGAQAAERSGEPAGPDRRSEGRGSGDAESSAGGPYVGEAALRRLARTLDRHREAADAAATAAAAAHTARIAPATAYALGVLHADQRAEVEAARFAFGRLWQQSAVPPGR